MNKINNTLRIFLVLIWLFILVHFLKDITQDILKIASPLDIFGDVKEDISFLPNFWQMFFYYGLGGLSFLVEAFLLVSIPLFLWKKQSQRLKKLIFAGIIYLVVFLTTCILLDPRFNLLSLINQAR